MGSLARRLKRNKMKKELGTNKIRDFWHQQHDPLWKRLQDGMKNAKEDRRK
jgi:hypothetical protein